MRHTRHAKRAETSCLVLAASHADSIAEAVTCNTCSAHGKNAFAKAAEQMHRNRTIASSSNGLWWLRRIMVPIHMQFFSCRCELAPVQKKHPPKKQKNAEQCGKNAKNVRTAAVDRGRPPIALVPHIMSCGSITPDTRCCTSVNLSSAISIYVIY